MMKNAAKLASLACALPLWIVTGCSDDPADKKPAPSAAAPATATAPRPVSVSVALEPRYEATLAQGIDFTRPGYPTFLSEVQGMSGHEPWGRWTDATLGPVARFRFTRSLPDRFTLELRASGMGPNAYEPVKVRVGSVERTVVLGNPSKGAQRLEFAGTGGADVIEVVAPSPVLARESTPGNMDPRKLGVGLESIKILD